MKVFLVEYYNGRNVQDPTSAVEYKNVVFAETSESAISTVTACYNETTSANWTTEELNPAEQLSWNVYFS